MVNSSLPLVKQIVRKKANEDNNRLLIVVQHFFNHFLLGERQRSGGPDRSWAEITLCGASTVADIKQFYLCSVRQRSWCVCVSAHAYLCHAGVM